MELQDDRTEQERDTHPFLVIGTDRFMSGWGKADGGVSFAAWACRPKDRRDVLAWVESRSDMMRVRETVGAYRPKGRGHCHVYVVRCGHPALGRYTHSCAECAQPEAEHESADGHPFAAAEVG